MANDFTASFEEVRAKEQQITFFKRSVAMVVADTSFRATMKSWDVLRRIYRGVSADDTPDVYVRGEDMPERSETDTAETLTVNKQFGIAIPFDDFDEIQSKYNLAVSYGNDYWIIMQTQIDADVLGEVVNGASTVDGWDVGATTGDGIVLTIVNVLNVITSVTKKLSLLNIYETSKFGIVSPQFEEVISLYYGAKATDLGDKVSQNGFFKTISGYELYSSNNLTGTASLGLATNPTAGDTIVINGVTFTAQSTIGTTAGNFKIGGNVDATRATLEAFIASPSTTSANQIALSATNARNFKARVSAVNDDTANTLVVTYKGVWVLTVSETLTAGGDVWTTTQQKQHCVFGIKKKGTTLVMQKAPTVEKERIQRQLWDRIKNGMLYGLKTFRDNSQRLVNVEIASSAY